MAVLHAHPLAERRPLGCALGSRAGARRWALALVALAAVLGRQAEAHATPSPSEPVAEKPQAPPEPAGAPAEAAHAEHRREELEPHDATLDAYDFDADEVCPFCEITPQWPEGRRGLHWHSHWQPVGWVEYVATPLLFATALAVKPVFGAPTKPRWTSPILFDQALQDALVVAPGDPQKRTSLASDILLYGSIAYPTVVDNLLVTWLARQSPRVAWQMFVINAQAYALTAAVTNSTKIIAARERPWGRRCPDTDDHDCNGSDRYVSYFSGHASMTATSAGLTCAHHTQLSLYKDPAMDTLACLAAVGFTAATGLFRMSSDNHWATDVVSGHLIGYLSGYLYPTLMYYREFRLTPEHRHHAPEPVEPSGPIWAVLPIVQERSVQLSAAGVF